MKELFPAIATVAAALLAAAASIIVAVIASKRQHERYLTEMDKQFALVMYRLEQMENKVNAHNTFDRRIVVLEEQNKSLKMLLDQVITQLSQIGGAA